MSCPWQEAFDADQRARRISGMTTWGQAAMVPSSQQETNDARNTREFFAHRKLVLERIGTALAAERKHVSNKSRLR